ncbi:hypothetical protein GCM10027047_30010 [Rhodococcus aerolatus]
MSAPTARPARAPRGRPRAIPDEELRDRMFTAAEQMLEAAGGFTLSTENVQLEAVMRRADVSRSAVYRVWPSKEDFAFELLTAFASNGAGGLQPFDPSGREEAAQLVRDHPDQLGSVEGRRELLVEAVRVVASRTFRTIIETRRWRRYPALTIAADGLDEERAEHVLATMRATEAELHRPLTEFYAAMFELLDLEPRPPFTAATAADALTRLTNALFEGLAMQHTVDATVGDTTYEGGWTLPALGFLAAVDGVTRPRT